MQISKRKKKTPDYMDVVFKHKFHLHVEKEKVFENLTLVDTSRIWENKFHQIINELSFLS